MTLPHTDHPNSIAVACDPAVIGQSVHDRRLIVEFIARQGHKGATDYEIAEACPTVHQNAVRARRGEAWARNFITNILGENRITGTRHKMQVWHATDLAIHALGLPSDSFCVRVAT